MLAAQPAGNTRPTGSSSGSAGIPHATGAAIAGRKYPPISPPKPNSEAIEQIALLPLLAHHTRIVDDGATPGFPQSPAQHSSEPDGINKRPTTGRALAPLFYVLSDMRMRNNHFLPMAYYHKDTNGATEMQNLLHFL